MSDPNVFILTADHVRLLRRMYVDWDDCEYGAPAIDPKRPYGNSEVDIDIAEILGWEPKGEDGDLDQTQREDAYEVHRQTQLALQIVLSVGAIAPGRYVKREKYDSRSWIRDD